MNHFHKIKKALLIILPTLIILFNTCGKKNFEWHFESKYKIQTNGIYNKNYNDEVIPIIITFSTQGNVLRYKIMKKSKYKRRNEELTKYSENLKGELNKHKITITLPIIFSNKTNK